MTPHPRPEAVRITYAMSKMPWSVVLQQLVKGPSKPAEMRPMTGVEKRIADQQKVHAEKRKMVLSAIMRGENTIARIEHATGLKNTAVQTYCRQLLQNRDVVRVIGTGNVGFYHPKA